LSHTRCPGFSGLLQIEQRFSVCFFFKETPQTEKEKRAAGFEPETYVDGD
jgi:hypothetical protein